MGSWTHNRKIWIVGGCCVLVLVIAYLSYFFLYRAPSDFPKSTIVEVPNGKDVTTLAESLKEDHVIRSVFMFKAVIALTRKEQSVKGGDYYFEKPLSIVGIAKRVTAGFYNVDQLETTIPEGSSVADISAIIKKRYPDFDQAGFMLAAKPYEGYLFPDTYIFGADIMPDQAISIMNDNFQNKITEPAVLQKINKFGKPLNQIIIMASILEDEAKDTRSRQIVAGILWQRINDGIPLQVDSTLRYVDGKTSAELTQADLKMDSPYNTYTHAGLPPTPISNPGLDSIMDAVTPIKTNYLYFLSDKNGTMHYATTLEGHIANIKKYLPD